MEYYRSERGTIIVPLLKYVKKKLNTNNVHLSLLFLLLPSIHICELMECRLSGTAGLLLVHLDGVTFLHLEGGGCIVFIDWLTVEPEAHHLHR